MFTALILHTSTSHDMVPGEVLARRLGTKTFLLQRSNLSKDGYSKVTLFGLPHGPKTVIEACYGVKVATQTGRDLRFVLLTEDGDVKVVHSIVVDSDTFIVSPAYLTRAKRVEIVQWSPKLTLRDTWNRETASWHGELPNRLFTNQKFVARIVNLSSNQWQKGKWEPIR